MKAACLLAGTNASKASETLGLSRNTLTLWAARLDEGRPQRADCTPVEAIAAVLGCRPEVLLPGGPDLAWLTDDPRVPEPLLDALGLEPGASVEDAVEVIAGLKRHAAANTYGVAGEVAALLERTARILRGQATREA